MSRLLDFSDDLELLVANATPSVVGIEQGRGQGTGTVIAQDGYILTNHHVVADSPRKLQVRFADGESLKGERVGSDPGTDLAVVRVDASDLKALPLTTAKPLRVGQMVVAIGNPFRFERSVSLGIVSAIDRSLPGPGGGFEGLVQTDAAINPGNSGGPLVNARGEVVGINTAVVPFAQGIGFAVPAHTASWVTAVLLQKGEVRRRYLGIAARSEPLPSTTALAAGQRRAVRVIDVGQGTPASTAGVREGDLLLTLNGAELSTVDDLQRVLVLTEAPGLDLELWRERQRVRLSVNPAFRQRAA